MELKFCWALEEAGNTHTHISEGDKSGGKNWELQVVVVRRAENKF